MKKIITTILTLFGIMAFCQEKNSFSKQEVTINNLLKGSLYTPDNYSAKTNLVILIAGSGPTNRDGNQIGTVNNSLKFLAEGLAKNDLAVFSYDKRIIAQMIAGNLKENDLLFENFINDANEVALYFRNQKKYNKIIIAGHSEGSLIGMVVAKNNADAFVSLEGAGKPIDLILEEQIMKQAPFLKNEVHEDLEILKSGKTFALKSENPIIKSLFRETVQPYIISWMKYNPQSEIQKLAIPILIVGGTKDIQVSEEDAKLLKTSSPTSEILILENMNHIFKEIKGDAAENKNSYTNPNLPVMNELIAGICQFIKKI